MKVAKLKGLDLQALENFMKTNGANSLEEFVQLAQHFSSSPQEADDALYLYMHMCKYLHLVSVGSGSRH